MIKDEIITRPRTSVWATAWIFLTAVSIVTGLVLSEYSYRIWEKVYLKPSDFAEDFPCRKFDDKDLGKTFEHNCRSRWKRWIGGQLVWDVEFSSDDSGWRTVPSRQAARRADLESAQTVLFFGGSTTLGSGVNDDETIPSYFKELSKISDVHNFGGTGFGPQHMLATLENPSLPSAFKQKIKDPILIFLFHDDYFARAAGRWNGIARWGRNFPYYELDQNENLERRGSFETGRPYTAAFHRLLDQLHLPRHLYESLGWKTRESDIRLTAAILEKARRLYEEKIGKGTFVVVFAPGSGSSKRFIPYLERFRIRYLDYSKLMELDSTKVIPIDNHPRPVVYRHIAKQLVHDLVESSR